jgi:co-chaperonin GroES (HSP10)
MSPSGLLHIPDVAKARCDQGIIKYTGPACKHLNEGDYVLFSPYSGDLVFLEDEGRVIVMREIAVIAIIHPPGTDIPGLYFMDERDGHRAFFQATYEVTTQFVRDAFRNNEWRKKQGLRAKMFGKVDFTLPEDSGRDYLEDAVLAERERCAKLAEEFASFHEPLGSNAVGREIAELIREPAQLEPSETT